MDWEWNGICHHDCAVVYRVGEQFGGLSNMSNEYPLLVNGVEIGSSEALYQACRFPHHPDWQREILDAPHAMRSKMASKKENRREDSRHDWMERRVEIMRWCLRLKLQQHFGDFFNVLKSTGDRMIVERSRKDRFWGAVPDGDALLRGENMLGKLLMELRDEVVEWMNAEGDDVEWPDLLPLDIPQFELLGRKITDLDV